MKSRDKWIKTLLPSHFLLIKIYEINLNITYFYLIGNFQVDSKYIYKATSLAKERKIKYNNFQSTTLIDFIEVYCYDET